MNKKSLQSAVQIKWCDHDGRIYIYPILESFIFKKSLNAWVLLDTHTPNDIIRLISNPYDLILLKYKSAGPSHFTTGSPHIMLSGFIRMAYLGDHRQV